MASKEELEKKLKEAREDLKDVHGTKCEVFSRVVGYMRPVQNWNNGKKEEFAMRKTYNIENPKRPCKCEGLCDQ